MTIAADTSCEHRYLPRWRRRSGSPPHAWVVTVRQMNGMDMGVATRLGSFAFFLALWVSMMAAMMLPGAAPAVVEARSGRRRCARVPLFVGVVPRRLDARRRRRVRAVPAARVARRRRGRDRGGVYELTPLKRQLPPALPRERPLGIRVRALLRRLEHRADADAGGAERHERRLDGRDRRARPRPEAPARERRRSIVPLALAIVGLGILIVIAPSSVPGLMPSM